MARKTTKKKTIEQVNEEFFGEFFNENTVKYLSVSAGSKWFKYLLLQVLGEVKPRSIKTLADIGCGIGHKTSILKYNFPKAKVSGFDFAQPAIKVAKKAYGLEGIRFSADDITKANYKLKYDLIAAFDVLEHIDDWQGLVKKLAKVNNRYLLFSFPVGRMRPYETKIGHYRNFQRNEMEDFLATIGYAKVKTYYAGFPFFSPILRDLTNIFFKNYSEISNSKLGFVSRLNHKVWYVLFRYFSMKNRGDLFIGLFEKQPTPVLKTKRKVSR